jgi:hypothetical protein
MEVDPRRLYCPWEELISPLGAQPGSIEHLSL